MARRITDEIRRHVEELEAQAQSKFDRESAVSLLAKLSQIAGTAEFYFAARVSGAKVVLPDGKTPQARIVLKAGKKARTVPQEGALESLLWSECGIGNGPGQDIRGLAARLEALWEPDRRMERQAAVTAAVSKALANDRKMDPVRDRIRRKREQERQGLLRNIKGALQSGYDLDLITEDDLLQLYREELVSKVLKS